MMLTLDIAQEGIFEYQVALQHIAYLATASFKFVFVGYLGMLFQGIIAEGVVSNNGKQATWVLLIFPITRHFAGSHCLCH